MKQTIRRSPSHPIKQSPSSSTTTTKHSPYLSPSSHHHHPGSPVAPSTPQKQQQRKDQPPILMVTPTDRPLTRKKWLESSDPGLFGGSSPAPSNHRDRPVREMNNRFKTSSPEKSRTKRSPHYDPQAVSRGDRGVDFLTNSVLEAIRDGRIRTGDTGNTQHKNKVCGAESVIYPTNWT